MSHHGRTCKYYADSLAAKELFLKLMGSDCLRNNCVVASKPSPEFQPIVAPLLQVLMLLLYQHYKSKQ